MNSRYVLTAEEEALLAAPLPASGSGAVELPGRGDRRFAAVLRSREPYVRPLLALVAVRTGPSGLHVTLHSNELRGYDGLSSFRARDTALELHGPSGVHRVPIFEGTLGGWFNPALTPWRSGPWPLPPGPHRLDLVMADLAFAETGPGEGPRRLTLAERFP
jgi:hypothetical protein